MCCDLTILETVKRGLTRKVTCMRAYELCFSLVSGCSASGRLCSCILDWRKLEKNNSQKRVIRIAKAAWT